MAEASGSCTRRPEVPSYNRSTSGHTASAGQGIDGSSSGTDAALLALRAAATEVAVLARWAVGAASVVATVGIRRHATEVTVDLVILGADIISTEDTSMTRRSESEVQE